MVPSPRRPHAENCVSAGEAAGANQATYLSHTAHYDAAEAVSRLTRGRASSSPCSHWQKSPVFGCVSGRVWLPPWLCLLA